MKRLKPLYLGAFIALALLYYANMPDVGKASGFFEATFNYNLIWLVVLISIIGSLILTIHYTEK